MSEFVETLPCMVFDWAWTVILPGCILAVLGFMVFRLLEKRGSPGFWKRYWLGIYVIQLMPLGFAVWSGLGYSSADQLQWALFALGRGTSKFLELTGPVLVLLLLAYLAGLILNLSLVGSRYLASWHLIGLGSDRRSEGMEGMLKNLARRCGLVKTRLILTDLSPGPSAWGIRKPLVLMPSGLEDRLSTTQIETILLHELAHHRGQDILLALALDLGAAILWFHPGIRLARKEWSRLSEECNDQFALVHASGADWRGYAETLLQVMEWQDGRASLQGTRGLAASRKELKHRFKALQRQGNPPVGAQSVPRRVRPVSPGFVLSCVAMCAALVLTLNINACMTYLPSTSELPPSDLNTDQYLQIAVNYCSQMKWNKAAILYGAVLDAEPGHELATHQLAKISLMQGRFDQVFRLLDQVCRDSGSVHTLKGRALDALGRREEAVEEYRKALELSKYEATITTARAGLDHPLRFRKAKPQAVVPDRLIQDKSLWMAEGDSYNRMVDTSLAFDADPYTRWSSLTPMEPGQQFILDLGREYPVTRWILVDDAYGNTIYKEDYPRDYLIEGAGEDGQWERLASAVGVPDEYAGGVWIPRPIRYLRMTQYGTTGGELWSIYDIQVYQALQTQALNM